MKHDVTWSMHDGRKVPEIYVDGEFAYIVSCGYQYVTSNVDSPGTCMMTATFFLKSDRTNESGQLINHVVAIDQVTGRTFYQ